MFLLTFCVAIAMFIRRTRDVKQGTTDPRYFKTYDLETKIPTISKQLSRHYINLFESPVLFYAIIALILAMDLDHPHFAILAYAYVAARLVHSSIHLTHNKLWPRIISFFVSFAILGALWVRALIIVVN